MSTVPPGPSSKIPFKIFLDFKNDPLGFVRKMGTYGDISHIKLGGQRIYLLNEPELVKTVLMDTQGRYTKGRSLGRAKILLGEGLLTSEGELHHRQKRLMMPAFHRQRIPLYGAVMIEEAAKFAKSLQEGQSFDMWQSMMSMTLDIAGKTMFGSDLESESKEVSAALTTIMQKFDLVSMPGSDLWMYLPIPSAKAFRNAKKRLDEVVYKMIAQGRIRTAERVDLMSMLLMAQDEDTGVGMTDIQVRDEVMTLFLAGHETTSNAMSWAWTLLAQNPEADARLYAELKEVLGDRQPTAADYPNLKFCERVFSETLRMYPPAWVLGRRIRDTQTMAGYEIPKQSIILMSQALLHRDPRFWQEPNVFNPDRFLPEAKASRPTFSYFPFSAGPRGCIGEGFAWMEGVLLLATIAQKWRFELASDAVIAEEALITLRPKFGVKVVAKAR